MIGYRGKILAVEASIPSKWYTAGETVPITLVLTPTGYKKVSSFKSTADGRWVGLKLH